MLSQENGTLSTVDPQPASADLLGDLLGPLAIEGPPGTAVQSQQSVIPGVGGDSNAVDAAAIVPVGEEQNSVQVLSIAVLSNRWWVHYCFKVLACWVEPESVPNAMCSAL